MILIDSIKHLQEKPTIEPIAGKWFMTIPVSIDFILDLPRIEEKTCYKRNMSQEMRKRLQMLGNRLMIYYDTRTNEIIEIVAAIANLAMTTYKDDSDLTWIINKLLDDDKK